MPISCKCREVSTGSVIGYKVGASQNGDASSYIRNRPQQQQQQDSMIKGMPSISIYVQDKIGAGKAFVGDEPQMITSANAFVIGKDFQADSEELHRKRSAESSLEHLDSAVSSCSSSIGVDNGSAFSYEDDASAEMEVESKYKGPLDCLAELEDSLPIKKGLSNFYSGKSKSFACLSDAGSVKDIIKQEHPYNKRRKNMLSYSGSSWDKSKIHSPRNNNSGISKKGMHSSRSTLALAVAMSQSEDSQETGDEEEAHLPPLPPSQGRRQRHFSSSARSFSLTDLQGV